MFAPADAGFLLDCWDLWEGQSSTLPLNHPATSQVAHTFVGFNLIRDLIRERRYLNRWARFAQQVPYGGGGVDCDHVVDWLTRPDVARHRVAPAIIREIVTPGAGLFVANRSPADPWRQINMWLIRESLVWHLSPPSGRVQTNAYTAARALFDGATIPPRPNMPPACQQRAANVHRQFDQWWEYAVHGLTTFLDWCDTTTTPPTPCWHVPPRWRGRVITRELCPAQGLQGAHCCPLPELVRRIDQQWASCVAANRGAAPVGVDVAYPEDVFSRRDPRRPSPLGLPSFQPWLTNAFGYT